MDWHRRNLTTQRSRVSADERAVLLGHRGAVIWLTGLSGAGKSTIGYALERSLMDGRRLAYVLDGDNLRQGLCADLDFSPEARRENVRRTGEVAALLADAGAIAIVALISPYRADRARARSLIPAGDFVEVFLDVPLAVCERRDPKGLYRRARAGVIRDLTGVGAPYEAPETPELVLDTDASPVEACVARIAQHLTDRGVFGT